MIREATQTFMGETRITHQVLSTHDMHRAKGEALERLVAPYEENMYAMIGKFAEPQNALLNELLREAERGQHRKRFTENTYAQLSHRMHSNLLDMYRREVTGSIMAMGVSEHAPQFDMLVNKALRAELQKVASERGISERMVDKVLSWNSSLERSN